MLIREIPFLRLVLPLCAGIVCGLFYTPSDNLFISAAIFVFLLFCTSLFFNKSLTNKLYGISLTITFFFTGAFLYRIEKENISVLEAGEAIYSGILYDFPEEKENTFSIVLKLCNRLKPEGTIPVKGSILLYHKKGDDVSLYRPGDRMVIKCSPLEIMNRGNPYEFDYKFYMENHGIKYYAFTDSSDVIRHTSPEHRKFIHKALIIREKIIAMYSARGITGERLALVSAITLGQKSMLEQDQKQAFLKAGVMHIMAVSGLHAIILSLFIFKILFFFKGKLRILRTIITILFLWMFAFVTGLTPSVMRATLMFTFLQVGSLMKRPVNSVNSVLASAFIIIISRPSAIFDAGFLLSYSAVIYIILFYRELYLKIYFSNRISDYIWQSVAVTIIAQLGTLPLTVILFNRFPTWFILSNVIIVPVSSMVIIAGCLVPLTFPLRFLSGFFARILGFLTGVTQYLTEKASSLPLSSIENIGMVTAQCIPLMIVTFLFTSMILKKRSVSPIIAAFALLLFILAGTVRHIRTKTTAELIVYNTTGYTTVGIRCGHTLKIFSDSLSSKEVNRHKAVLDLREKTFPLNGDPRLIMAGNKRILITGTLNSQVLSKLRPDYIILSGPVSSFAKDTGGTENAAELILSSGVSPGFRLPAGIFSQDNVFIVRKDGAFHAGL